MKTKNIDTSHELHVYRIGNGITLLKQEEITHKKKFLHDTQHTVDSILKLPLSVYFIRADSINLSVNENDAKLCGFDSIKNAVGKTCFSEFTDESSVITTNNDKYVMQHQTIKISEEDVVLSKGYIKRPTLSIKLPWYNSDNKVIGLFGCSIILNQHPLAESLAIVRDLGLFNTIGNTNDFIGIEINKNYLSKRQLSCANFLLTGMTVKQIAAHLNLSARTIETYIENLKEKLNCRNKTELIIKLTEILK